MSAIVMILFVAIFIAAPLRRGIIEGDLELVSLCLAFAFVVSAIAFWFFITNITIDEKNKILSFRRFLIMHHIHIEDILSIKEKKLWTFPINNLIYIEYIINAKTRKLILDRQFYRHEVREVLIQDLKRINDKIIHSEASWWSVNLLNLSLSWSAQDASWSSPK